MGTGILGKKHTFFKPMGQEKKEVPVTQNVTGTSFFVADGLILADFAGGKAWLEGRKGEERAPLETTAQHILSP